MADLRLLARDAPLALGFALLSVIIRPILFDVSQGLSCSWMAAPRSKACTNYSTFRRRFISAYAVSISFIRAVAST